METTTTTDSRLSSFLVLFDWHTDFFISALDGISDTDAQNRLDTKANHMAWLAGSLVQQRYELANVLSGENQKQQADELFTDNKGIQDGVAYPPLEQFKADWKKITPVAREAFINADAAILDGKIMMPGMEMTRFELVSFSIYREANCIGQIALWRRLLGYDAMKYM
jgi:hypothetical protein